MTEQVKKEMSANHTSMAPILVLGQAQCHRCLDMLPHLTFRHSLDVQVNLCHMSLPIITYGDSA
jgi:hypothetical protein